MLKRINWKAVLTVFLWIISIGGVVALMSFIEVKKGDAKVTDIKVLIPGMESFIDRDEIDAIILQNSGRLIGRSLASVDIQEIEEAIIANPYIKDAKVYADMDGVISIQIDQREPVLRILNYVNQDYYIDKEGLKVPVSHSYTPHVLVANGFIMEGFNGKVDTMQTKLAKDLYKTAVFIERDTLWKEQIEQLYVNEQREIEMIPRVGNHKIILGDADSLKNKFRNLLIFYKKAIPRVGWDAYKTINIKYSNQIVCVKSGLDSTSIQATVAPNPATATTTGTKTIKDTITTATR
ncbi:cell division protein FtsQ/DivIB [Pedobacter sp. SYSU D00535]|uniref:cell division protein FtsQ/DivIB n=1 Tax=Pedobacter sp. SYSU D00535 TaxID=2810308 RepID=UPI001A967335|nr:FtsQ-type POTRA domain-containing protein [Pedobacter sp. SYSU D00535]